MATVTTNARILAIHLSERVREDPELARQMGIRVDFKQNSTNKDRNDKDRKDADHESQ